MPLEVFIDYFASDIISKLFETGHRYKAIKKLNSL